MSSSQRRRQTCVNTAAQLINQKQQERDVLETVRHHLQVRECNKHRTDCPNNVSVSRRHLRSRFHKFPLALASFAEMGSITFNLYNVKCFDKLHVTDMGILRQFCYLKNTFIQNNSGHKMSRLMSTVNQRYLDLTSKNVLSCHRPFRSSQDDSQAGISGQIRRKTSPFLWVILIAVSDQRPDNDMLLKCHLKLDRAINLLSESIPVNDSNLIYWQDFLLKLGIGFSTLFNLDIYMNRHRLMRHVSLPSNNLGCIRIGSSEESKTYHKNFEKGVKSTKRHFVELLSSCSLHG